MVAFGDWLTALYRAHAQVGLSTLNYDVLLERMLIDEDVFGLKPEMTDFFSELDHRRRPFELVPGHEPIVGRPFRPEAPVDRPIELHHLHGCLTHFRLIQDGTVWKFDASDVHAIRPYEYLLTAEEADVAPLRRPRVAQGGEGPRVAVLPRLPLARAGGAGRENGRVRRLQLRLLGTRAVEFALDGLGGALPDVG